LKDRREVEEFFRELNSFWKKKIIRKKTQNGSFENHQIYEIIYTILFEYVSTPLKCAL
jgi:hypothetical protein